MSGVGTGVRASAGSLTLLWRLAGLGVLLFSEMMVLSLQVDVRLLSLNGGLLAYLHTGHIWRAVIAFVSLAMTFGLITARSEFQRISRALAATPISWSQLIAHGAAMAVFAVLSNRVGHVTLNGRLDDGLAVAWLASGMIAVAFGWSAVMPWNLTRELWTGARSVWVVATLGAILAVSLEDFRRLLWGRVIGLTVNLVQVFLHPFVPDLTVNPSSGTFASHRFHLVVTPECAGFEGAGLLLVFGIAWLLIFRKECRFPQALFLIPASIVVAWLLNSVRLAALFVIGNAGAPGIALGGFHSQAGWIAFSGVALGFTLALHHVPGLTKPVAPTIQKREHAGDATGWYLIPFLAILAAAMITRAASDRFEWLYPIRFVAAAVPLWHYRKKYATLAWRISWAGPLAGILVFVMWLGLERWMPSGTTSVISAGLAALSAPARVTWIVFRVLAASVTVPIAEELAFRGFLLRRLVAADFEKVSPASFTLLSFILSSLAFGVLHGDRWIAGTCAGLIYAGAFRYRGKFGDAVAAHAITNLLLAAWVLATGAWQMW